MPDLIHYIMMHDLIIRRYDHKSMGIGTFFFSKLSWTSVPRINFELGYLYRTSDSWILRIPYFEIRWLNMSKRLFASTLNIHSHYIYKKNVSSIRVPSAGTSWLAIVQWSTYTPVVTNLSIINLYVKPHIYKIA